MQPQCPHLVLIDFQDVFDWLVSDAFLRVLRLGSAHCQHPSCYSTANLWSCLSSGCHKLFCSSDPQCHAYSHYNSTSSKSLTSFSHCLCINIETGVIFCHLCKSSVLALQSGPFADDVRDLYNAIIRPKKAISIRTSHTQKSLDLERSFVSSSPKPFPGNSTSQPQQPPSPKSPLRSRADSLSAVSVVSDLSSIVDFDLDESLPEPSEMLSLSDTLSELKRSLSSVSLSTPISTEPELGSVSSPLEPIIESPLEEPVAESPQLKESIKERKAKRLERMRSRSSSISGSPFQQSSTPSKLSVLVDDD
ncbi:hypothetical protein RCL1_004533 [Eukaryota sp. TZLM3-RCL]